MFCTSWFTAPQYVVKIVDPEAKEEATICEFLQQTPGLEAPDNHTIPCDVIHHNAEKTVLVMPYLPSMKAPSTLDGCWLESFLDAAYQLLEVCMYSTMTMPWGQVPLGTRGTYSVRCTFID